MKTVLITGTSSGIGKAAVKHFQQNGWQVAATMRRPENEAELGQLENVKLYALDVTSNESVKNAIQSAIKDFGGLDVIVNNAGYGLAGPFETATEEQIARQYDTNLFGVMRVMREALPYFREQKAGTFVNITSIGGLITLPFNSLYHGTKWALEGFTESLAYEVEPLGIKVRLVEPGGVRTDFAGRSLVMTMDPAEQNAYSEILQKTLKVFMDPARQDSYSSGEQIAEVIYEAATSESNQLRFIAGEDAKEFWAGRQSMKVEDFNNMIKDNLGLGKEVEA